MKSLEKKKLGITLSIFMVVGLACSLFQRAAPAQPTPTLAAASAALATQPPAGPSPTPPAGVQPPTFALYQPVSIRLPEKFAQAGAYTLPLDLANVQGMDTVELSDAQRTLLEKNGFVVAAPVPGKFREFYQIYESRRYAKEPLFITTDAVYHVYHLLFDKMLRELENQYFIKTLTSLTDAMVKASLSQLQALKGTPLEEPALRNTAYFAVAASLLNPGAAVPPEAADLVKRELALIDAHKGADVSPIWDRADLPSEKKLVEDYSQYIPRGHYTRSEALKQYFRAMIWYGRMTLRLRDDFETRRALLITQSLRQVNAGDGTPALTLWQNIYEPTVFIVGKSDDLSYYEYGALSDAVFGAGASASAFGDDALLAKFLQAAASLPPPQVNSMWVWINEDKTLATKGFRFMGQRFTLDAYVFGQMIWREVGTLDNPRGLPKALDFFAAMGSEEALTLLKGMGENKYEKFDQQMAKVQKEIAALQPDSWTQNLYWSWLYALQPLLTTRDQRFPPFMQTQAWVHKDLHTALGSWTELKHDTILYAKQVMAEMGGGPSENPPHGYVEPNPEAFARLQALARMTRQGLSERHLDLVPFNKTFDDLINELVFLQKAAEMELAGETLSDDDYWHIQYYGGLLEQFTLRAADTGSQQDRDLSDQKAALIADVATGISKDGSLVALEEAEGQPAVIHVVLPGTPLRVATGAVFTYYEFPVPVDQRMTDEQWQAKVETGDIPKPPDWTASFLAP